MPEERHSRRAFFKRATTLAASGVAVASTTGCASMPIGSAAASAHPCGHRHCRFYKDEAGRGRCALAVRAEGGAP